MTSLGGFENLVLPHTTLYAGTEPLTITDVEHDEDPCSGAVFADIPIASMANVDSVVSAANIAFYQGSWRTLAPLQRERLLHRFADAIEADLPRLAALEALDTGKPVAIAEAVDIPAAVAWLRTYAGWPSKLGGRTGALAATAGNFHVYTRREPVGVGAAVLPWIFRFDLLSR